MTAQPPEPGPDQSGLAEDHAREWIAPGPAAASLADREAYRGFVKGLYAKIETRMADRLDAETQAEVAELARLLTTMPRNVVDEHRAAFETAFDLLAAGTPNVLVIRSLRVSLATAALKSSSPLARVLLRVCGDAPLTAVLSALASIFLLSFVAIFAMDQGHRWLMEFYDIAELPIGQLMLLVHAAFIGSIVSVMVRVRDLLKPAAFGPLLLYISVLSKPFVAVAFALLAYTVLKTGLVSSAGIDLDGPQGPYLAWALGFLSGFSERFAQDFVIDAGAEFGRAGPPDAGFSMRRPQDDG